MISEFDDTSTELVVETPSGLPENVRHAMNVLSLLGVRDDSMFLALVNDCIQADPLHLCRMVKSGLVSSIDGVQNDRIAFSGTELHIPFGTPDPLPPREVIISLRDNATIASYFDKEDDQYQYIASRPIFDHQILSYLDEIDEDDGSKRTQGVVDLIDGLQHLAQMCYINQSPLETENSLMGEVAAELM